MTDTEQIITSVRQIYEWLDTQISSYNFQCRACGGCCNFESYGHRLFITSPEILYFKHNLKHNLRTMTGGTCPYMTDNSCSVHDYRFAGCRVFFCSHPEKIQNRLSETAVEKLKKICTATSLPYKYTDLKTALNSI